MSPETLLAEKLSVYRGSFDKGCRGLFEDSNGGSDSASAAQISGEVKRALHFIAEDFAHEFNAKLATAARNDPTVELVADKYEMGPAHVEELEQLLAAPVAPLLANLEGDDLDGARGLIEDVWARLEKRIRSRWQAYFVLTFQDVSVERKAARDRKKLQPRFNPNSADVLAQADENRRALPDFVTNSDEPAGAIRAWLVVAAVLTFAAAIGWLLMRSR